MQISFRPLLKCIFIFILVTVCAWMVVVSHERYNFLKEWYMAANYRNKQSGKRLVLFRNIIVKNSIAENYPEFLKQIGKEYLVSGKYREALDILNKSARLSVNPEVLYLLGEANENLKQLDEAERIYLLVGNAIPNLLRPKYLLAKLYLKKKDIKAFKTIAFEIKDFQPKLNIISTEEMKNEIDLLLTMQLD